MIVNEDSKEFLELKKEIKENNKVIRNAIDKGYARFCIFNTNHPGAFVPYYTAVDFVEQLKQMKSYVIDEKNKVDLFNLSPDAYISCNKIDDLISDFEMNYTLQNRENVNRYEYI